MCRLSAPSGNHIGGSSAFAIVIKAFAARRFVSIKLQRIIDDRGDVTFDRIACVLSVNQRAERG